MLIVTAIKLEYDAVLAVSTGALAGSEWEERPGPTKLKVAFRTFHARGGGTLRVAVTRALRMGGEHAVNAAAPLIDAYDVRCVAMCGVCAGRRGDVSLGDVVIADHLWKYDAGKLKVETVDGHRVKRVQGETITYGLPVEWQQPAEDFEPDRTQAWLARRPRGHEAQGDWILASIANGDDPRKAADRAVKCPDYAPLPAEAGPAALLNARHTVVDFVGREEPLADLRAFCETGAPVDARLVVGAGGMGKTRLLMELCKRLNKEEIWRAGFVPKDLISTQFEALAASDRPTLAVIDYAESRPGLKALLEAARSHKLGKLRIVLLARNAGDWLASLRETSALVKDLLSAHTPLELAALAKTGDSRKEAFQNALKGFARALGTDRPTTAGPNLNDPRYARFLYVHMAALATVQGRPVTAATLLNDTLDHEQRFWLTRFPHGDSLDGQLLTEKIGRAISALTLVGGAPDRPTAKKIVAQATEASDDKLTLFLHTLYPGNQRTAGHIAYAGGLEPDLLGEAMVLRTLIKEPTEVGPYLDRIFESADQGALRTGFEVLGRLSGDHPEAGEWISRILDCDVAARALPAYQAALAIVEDDSIGERAAHSRLGLHLARALTREGTLAIALEMNAVGLPEQTISLSLREVRVWVTETRLLHLPESAEEKRARLLNNLGNRQRELGQREAALAFIHEAVDLYRKLATARPDAFLPELAMSLTSLGNRQSALGQHEAALASTQEALDALWPHFLALPAAHGPLATMILVNLLIHHKTLDRELPPDLLARIAVYEDISPEGDPEGQ